MHSEQAGLHGWQIRSYLINEFIGMQSASHVVFERTKSDLHQEHCEDFGPKHFSHEGWQPLNA